MDEQGGANPQLATLADLCELGVPVDRYYAQIGKTVRFKPAIALDRLLALQQKYNMITGGRGARDSRGFLMAVLQEVLVVPAIKTPEDVRILGKANAAVLLDILGDVLGRNEESFQAVVEDLGEPSSPS